MVIVGWAMDIRGQLPNLTVAIEKLHRTYFGGEHQILYLMDSLEKEDAFYSLKNGYLKRRAGYYIYYAQKSFALSAIIDDERKKDTSIQKKQNEKQEMMQEDNQKEKNQEQESWSEHFFAEMKNDENYAREEENEKERTSSYRTDLEQKGQKTKMIPSYGLSILLFLVVCGLGFAAFQNHQKMNAMETALMQMNSAKMTETETQTPASETDVTVKVESVEGNIIPQDNAQYQPVSQEVPQDNTQYQPVSQDIPQDNAQYQPVSQEVPQDIPQDVPQADTNTEVPVQAAVAQAAPVQQASPAFCGNCGTPVTPGASFCRNCGNKLN